VVNVVENPILNSPYEPPTRHWKFDDDGITDEVQDGRRPSAYFMPIPATKRRQAAQAGATRRAEPHKRGFAILSAVTTRDGRALMCWDQSAATSWSGSRLKNSTTFGHASARAALSAG
jgi:hypothetical protein